MEGVGEGAAADRDRGPAPRYSRSATLSMRGLVTTFDQPPMTPYGARYRPQAGPRRLAVGVQRGVRLFGRLTASLRVLPDYLIIGTRCGGTASLARWLLEHPGVQTLFPAWEHRTGTSYFDLNYDRGQAWYQSHFPTRSSHELVERRNDRWLLIGEDTDPITTHRQVLDFLELEHRNPNELHDWHASVDDPLHSSTRAELQTRLAPDIAAVEELLGRSMHWT